jgi:phage tail-like protein
VADPGTSLRFDVVVDQGGGRTQLGTFTSCQGLAAEYEVFEYQEGGENGFVHRIPGRLRYPNLVLTRGLDASSGAVAAWFAGQVEKVERTTAVVTAYDPAGGVIARWSLRDVCPVRWTGPSFSAGSANVATETLELAHNGFSQEGT